MFPNSIDRHLNKTYFKELKSYDTGKLTINLLELQLNEEPLITGRANFLIQQGNELCDQVLNFMTYQNRDNYIDLDKASIKLLELSKEIDDINKSAWEIYNTTRYLVPINIIPSNVEQLNSRIFKLDKNTKETSKRIEGVINLNFSQTLLVFAWHAK